MDPTEKELEDRLREVGSRLASPPSDVDDLLRLLDQTEIILSRVEQSPSASMLDSLRPALNFLSTKEFLHHQHTDVRVFVAACISEITRITAPDAPYDDDLMKEVFTMIVDAFGKLEDMSSYSYSKTVSILETVAKVRSCVIMLDLECDGLVLQMFKLFFKTIRPDHDMNVFSSMETIMTLVLDESEDISQELLICLLSNVLKCKKDILPVARRLAEKVISKCAIKLKPYILVVVQSMGSSLSDYDDIVASVCQERSFVPEQEESEKLVKAGSFIEEVGHLAGKSGKMMANGSLTSGNSSPVVDPLSKHEADHLYSSEQYKNDVATSTKINNLDNIRVKPDSKQEPKLKVKKSSIDRSSIKLTDTSDSSRVGGAREAPTSPSRKTGRKRNSKILKYKSDKVVESDPLLDSKGENEIRPQHLESENACVSSAFPIETSRGSGRSKRGRAANRQLSSKKGSVDNTSARKLKKVSGSPKTEKEFSSATVSDVKENIGLVSKSEKKSPLGFGGKSLDDTAADGAASENNDTMLQRHDSKKSRRKVTETDLSGKQHKSNIKKSKVKDVTERDVCGEPCLKDMIASSKALIAQSNDQNHSRKNLKTNSRKKRQRGELTSSIQQAESELNEDIVGSKIEVWWPDDEMFYKGTIDSYDREEKKHKIVYDDGDVEVLTLKNEHWKYHDDEKYETGQEDVASPKVSLEVPLKKPRKSRGSSRRRGNTIATPNSEGKSRQKSMGGRTRLSGSGKSSLKPRRRHRHEIPLGDRSSGDGAFEILGKDEGNMVESSIMNNFADYTPDAKSNGKSKENSSLSLPPGKINSGSKPKGRPRGQASRLGSISDEKAVEVKANSEGVNDESSRPSNPDNNTPIVEYKTSRSRRKNKGSKDKNYGKMDANVSSKRKLQEQGNEKAIKINVNDKRVSVKSSQTSNQDNDTSIINSKASGSGRNKMGSTAEKYAKTDTNVTSKRKLLEQGKVKAIKIKVIDERVSIKSSQTCNPDNETSIIVSKVSGSGRKKKGATAEKSGKTDANVSSKRKLQEQGNEKAIKIKENNERVSVKSSQTSNPDNETSIIESKISGSGRKKKAATAEKFGKRDANVSSERKLQEQGNEKDTKIKVNDERFAIKSSQTSNPDNYTSIIDSKSSGSGRKKKGAAAEKSSKTDAAASSKRKLQEQGYEKAFKIKVNDERLSVKTSQSSNQDIDTSIIDSKASGSGKKKKGSSAEKSGKTNASLSSKRKFQEQGNDLGNKDKKLRKK